MTEWVDAWRQHYVWNCNYLVLLGLTMAQISIEFRECKWLWTLCQSGNLVLSWWFNHYLIPLSEKRWRAHSLVGFQLMMVFSARIYWISTLSLVLVNVWTSEHFAGLLNRKKEKEGSTHNPELIWPCNTLHLYDNLVLCAQCVTWYAEPLSQNWWKMCSWTSGWGPSLRKQQRWSMTYKFLILLFLNIEDGTMLHTSWAVNLANVHSAHDAGLNV